jgi:hypothetical protein
MQALIEQFEATLQVYILDACMWEMEMYFVYNPTSNTFLYCIRKHCDGLPQQNALAISKYKLESEDYKLQETTESVIRKVSRDYDLELHHVTNLQDL